MTTSRAASQPTGPAAMSDNGHATGHCPETPLRVAPQRIDRRAVRTRRALQQALARLILRKDYEGITIGEICREADVARSTFYAHFADKDELKRSGISDELSLLLKNVGAGHQPLGCVPQLLEHARAHLHHYRALRDGAGAQVALGEVRHLLASSVRTDLSSREFSLESSEREAATQYLVGASMAVLTWWLDGGAELPPAQVGSIVRKLVLGGLASCAGSVWAGCRPSS